MGGHDACQVACRTGGLSAVVHFRAATASATRVDCPASRRTPGRKARASGIARLHARHCGLPAAADQCARAEPQVLKPARRGVPGR
jgi:hypothetical protein